MGTAAIITAIAGLVSAIGGLGLFKRHRRKKREREQCDESTAPKPAEKP